MKKERLHVLQTAACKYVLQSRFCRPACVQAQARVRIMWQCGKPLVASSGKRLKPQQRSVVRPREVAYAAEYTGVQLRFDMPRAVAGGNVKVLSTNRSGSTRPGRCESFNSKPAGKRQVGNWRQMSG